MSEPGCFSIGATATICQRGLPEMSGKKSEIFAKPRDEICLGKFRFLRETGELTDERGTVIQLRRQSSEVLAFLVARPGKVVPKAALIEEIWPETFVTDDSLGQCIVDIRRALDDTDHKIVQTFPKKGYMLVPTEQPEESAGRSASVFQGLPVYLIIAGAIVLLGATLVFRYWNSEPGDATMVALPLPDGPSIIVLPFDNQSDDTELDYLAAGFSTSVRTQLSKFPEFFVIAGSTSITFKDNPGTARGIGRELGVRYVLDGSIRNLPNGVLVNTELVAAETERTVWAEQFDLSHDNALRAQAEIVTQIVATLNVVVGEEELATILSHPTNDPDAYHLFMRAEAASQLLTQAGRAEAVELLMQAVERDPDYLAAHFELSGRYLSLYRFGGAKDPEEAVRLARWHADRALEINRSDYRGHFRLGMLHLFADHDHELALAAFTRAIKENPNDADVLYNMGFLRALMGEPKEAIEWNDKAKRINPRYPGWYNFNAAQSRFFMRDYREAETLARTGMAEYPTSLAPRRILIATLVEAGRLGEAKREVEEYLAISPNFRLSSFRNTPFQHSKDRDRYYGALRTAGIPD